MYDTLSEDLVHTEEREKKCEKLCPKQMALNYIYLINIY